jgi:hypothetical protein
VRAPAEEEQQAGRQLAGHRRHEQPERVAQSVCAGEINTLF